MAVEQIGGASGIAAMPLVAENARPNATSASQTTQPGAGKAVAAAAPAPSTDDVRDAIKKIEQVIPPSAQDLRFSIDQESGVTIVKLIDTQTQTVLRQIPTVEVMEISKALDKLQGLLVKEKA